MKISYMIKIILTVLVLVQEPKRFLIQQQYLKSGVVSIIIAFLIFLTEVVLYYRITAKNEVTHNNRIGDFIPHY